MMATEAYSQIATEALTSIEWFAKFDSLLKDASEESYHGISRESILDERARFNIWARNIKAFQDHNRRSSLGARLRAAPKVAQLVVEGIKNLNETLDDCKRTSSRKIIGSFLIFSSVLHCVRPAGKSHHLPKRRGAIIPARYKRTCSSRSC